MLIAIVKFIIQKIYRFIPIFFTKRPVLFQDYNVIPNVTELFFQVKKALNQREFGTSKLFSVLRKLVGKVEIL